LTEPKHKSENSRSTNANETLMATQESITAATSEQKVPSTTLLSPQTVVAGAAKSVNRPCGGEKRQELIKAHYVLVGGGTASYSAMKAIQERDSNADVITHSFSNQLNLASDFLGIELF
jgi:activator of 2-hydroxyglutaryl-CoA dehydratase